jgi:hypothetical protein
MLFEVQETQFGEELNRTLQLVTYAEDENLMEVNTTNTKKSTQTSSGSGFQSNAILV